MARDRVSEGAEEPATETGERLSRRLFTKTLGAGVGALALGAGTTGSVAAREKSGKYDTLDVSGGDFLLQVNPWGSERHGEPWDQTIWTESDGSFGYEWEEGASNLDPNYPEAMIGAKPWGPETDAGALPVQRGDVDEFEVTVDIDSQISGSNWNLALEWWLSDQKQPNGGEKDYEIMLVLDVGDSFGHDNYEDAVYTDKFGNTVDWWGRNISGGTGADFHQFYVSGGLTSGSIDLKRLVDFVEERLDPADDLWLSGVEIGNEYYKGVSGETTFNQFDVTINGTTYTSGPGDGGGDSGDGGDSDDGSGALVDAGVYRVRNVNSGKLAEVANASQNDGANVRQWEDLGGDNQRWDIQPADGENVYTLTAQHSGKRLTIDDRNAVQEGAADSDAQRFRLRDVDAEGYQLESVANGDVLTVDYSGEANGYNIGTFRWLEDPSNTSNQRWELLPESDDGGSDDPSGDGLLVNDFDTWAEEQNDLGNWTGAGGFENDDGEVVDGALQLDYNNAGWMATVVDRDIGDYSQLVLRVKGATGDETDDFTLDWQNGRTNLAELTDDTIGTSFGDVAVDLADIGVDTSSPGQLNLDFWEGADSVVYIDEIRLA